MTQSAEPILQVRDLKIDFSADQGILPVLRGLSYSLPKGRVLGVVGESGSGKTVHALSILRLLPPARASAAGKSSTKAKTWLPWAKKNSAPCAAIKFP